MNYEDARSQIKSGDILAFGHVGWNSWHDLKIQGIRFFTQSEYCHIATAWVCGGRVFVLEAVTPKIRIFPLSMMGEFYWIPMNAPWTTETEEFALSKVGEHYSQWQAVESFFSKPKADKLWQCCEYSRTVAEKDGIIIPGKYTPTGTVKGLQELDKNVILVNNK
jgi:hypothetical protein